MKYLARLKSEKHSPSVLPKLPEPPIGSLGSSPCRDVFKKSLVKTDRLAEIKTHKAEIIDIVIRRLEVDDHLFPCPLCAGNEFIESIRGGYFCIACQTRPPEEIKRRMNGRQPAYALGYGCGKCGSNNYAGIVQGWLCLGCGEVYEIIGGSSGPDIIQDGFRPNT